MHRQWLVARPGLLDEDIGGDVPDLAGDVELAEPVQPLPVVGIGGKLDPAVVRDSRIGCSQ